MIDILASQAKALLGDIPEAAPFLRAWPEPTVSRPFVPASLPVLGCIGDLAAGTCATTAGFVDAIVSAAPDLAWRQTYGPEDFGTAFLDHYGWSEFIGLRGPIASTDVACGILLLGPHTTYPAHAHEASELYLPLSGTALWRRGVQDWRACPPGRVIHHPSWMMHAMTTGTEPLLALYVWMAGDLAAKSIVAGAEG